MQYQSVSQSAALRLLESIERRTDDGGIMQSRASSEAEEHLPKIIIKRLLSRSEMQASVF